jgi:tyrosinase
MRARYVEAAKTFRMPYWDWAAHVDTQLPTFPTTISSPTISVIDVDGATKQINNPLFSFRFDDKDIPKNLMLDSTVRTLNECQVLHSLFTVDQISNHRSLP